MARGKDSARDPRRSLSPAIRAAIQAQNARRAYMFGEESINTNLETAVANMDPLNQLRTISRVESSTDEDIDSFMRRPPVPPSRHGDHGERPARPEHHPGKGENFAMTRAEYLARGSGEKMRNKIPSSMDPFPFGITAAQRDSPVSSERPEAAFKRSTGEGSTTKPNESMVEAEKGFKKITGHALMHPSTLDESSSPAVRDAAKSQNARRSRNVVEDEDE
jgi:hypothetical protein